MTNSSEELDPKQIRRSRMTLLLIVGVFVLPFLFALIVTSDLERFYPGEAVHGELIKPAIELQEFALRDSEGLFTLDDLKGHWTLIYITPGNCAAECQQNIHMLRQVHTALGAVRTRVKKLVVLGSTSDAALIDSLQQQYANMSLVKGADSFVNQFQPVTGTERSVSSYYFVVDPLAQVMMRYQVSEDQKGLLKDLKKLLKLSRIG